jgi:hypothetical protein
MMRLWSNYKIWEVNERPEQQQSISGSGLKSNKERRLFDYQKSRALVII